MGKSATQLSNEGYVGWSVFQAAQAYRASAPDHWPIITISREYGADPQELLDLLASRTGFDVWDRRILQGVAQETGGKESALTNLDERRRDAVADVLHSMIGGREHSNAGFLHGLMRVIHAVEREGKAILVGRGANYICDAHRSYRVRLVRPLDVRAREYAAREGTTVDEAQRTVLEHDASRADFVRQSFRHDVACPSDYDLVLNSAAWDLEGLADLLLAGYAKKFGRLPVVAPVSSS